MGSISSGVGLFSGLNYVDIVDQLMEIDAKPRKLVEERISKIDAQKTAYLDISARVSALMSRLNTLASESTFQSKSSSSSNEGVLTSVASTETEPGTHQFIVRSLATTHRTVSGGFQSLDAAPGAGTLTIESAAAKVADDTLLEELNGYRGVARGAFQLIDSQGNAAEVNITDARTLDDVIDRINAAGIGVSAGLDGDRLVLNESAGGRIEIREVNGGTTAATLGFAAGGRISTTGALSGAELITLTDTTPLAALNDGLGVRHRLASTDFTITDGDNTVNVELSEVIKSTTRLERFNSGNGVELGEIEITTRDGVAHTIDLADVKTVGDLKTALEQGTQQSDGRNRLNLVMTTGRLIINDISVADDQDPASDLIISDVDGRTARDLGLAGSTASNRLEGRDVLSMNTVADVLAAINYAGSNFVTDDSGAERRLVNAQIGADGKRLELSGDMYAAEPFTITAAEGSQALRDLGLSEGSYKPGGTAHGDRIVGGINTTLLATLNGGRGFTPGVVQLNQGASTIDVDLTGAETLREVTTRIQSAADAAGLQLNVGYDRTGAKLSVTSTDGSAITISDSSGTFAEDIGLAGSGPSLTGDNLQKQYLNEASALADLNGGKGVDAGRMRIQDSSGKTAFIDIRSLPGDNLETVINLVNAAAVDVEARINDTGDGILLIDQASGAGTLTVSDEDGSPASDLNIAGTATDGQIDGSFEYRFELDGSLGLSDLAERISAETSLASATIFNDGSGVTPYRLSINALTTGAAGELIIDTGTTGLNFNTLSHAKDASIILGESADAGILMTSSSNTFKDVIGGLTLDVHAVSDTPVTINVEQDFKRAVDAAKGFVTDFNSMLTRIDELGSYDLEAEKKGVLFGESSVRTIENRLLRELSRSSTEFGELTRLTRVGISFDAGGKLQFDESTFREKLEEDPEGIAEFFTDADGGRAVRFKEVVESITGASGVIKRRSNALEDQQELLSDRVDRMNALLEQRRERLLREFIQMEEILGNLNSQQESLSQMGSLSAG